jgi:hypothetical protein
MTKIKRNMGVGFTKEKREILLAEPRHGILSVARENRGPVSVPVWHRWDAETGELRLTSGIKTRKGEALVAAGRATYTLMDDHGGYVMLEGPVTYDEEYDHELELVGTGMRYLPESGEDYVRSSYMNDGKPWPGIVLWRIKAESWLSYDAKTSKAG